MAQPAAVVAASHGVAGAQPPKTADGSAPASGGLAADLMTHSGAPSVGDLGVLQRGTKKMQERLDLIKQQVEAANSATYSTYKVVTFKEQVVEGKNFYVKVFVGGDDKCIHVKIVKPIKQIEYVGGVQGNKTFLSPIVFF